MSFDLNAAETGNSTDLIPEGTVARAILNIRAGGEGDGGWLKMSKGGGLMIDTEWTILSGPFAKRKVWRYMSLSEKAYPITMRQLRAVVEGNYGILPEDMSDAAQAKRRCGFPELQGMEACIMISIEKSVGYDDKNGIKAILTPGESKYIARDGAAPAPSTQAAPPPTAGVAKPSWAA
jgi:hypothetical protein